jgi:hypothetical protein
LDVFIGWQQLTFYQRPLHRRKLGIRTPADVASQFFGLFVNIFDTIIGFGWVLKNSEGVAAPSSFNLIKKYAAPLQA